MFPKNNKKISNLILKAKNKKLTSKKMEYIKMLFFMTLM